jgi:hypothetical protein
MLLSCGNTPVEKYDEAVKNYMKGDIDRVLLEDAFFKAFGKEKPGNETLFFNKRVILNRSDDSIEFVFPEEIKLKIHERIEGSIEYADTGKNIFVLGNRKSFYIFTRTGELLASYKVKEEEKIDAIAASASGNSLFFLMDHTVYVYTPETGKAEKLVDGTFPPPYSIYYKADMIVQGNYLAIISGIAGAYYISVINTESTAVKMKNIAASSFEFAFTEDEVICIKGTSGKWSLNRYEYKLKNREKLTPIGKLAAIYLTQHGYLVEKDEMLTIYDYDNNSIDIPFDCSVSGRSGNSLIFRFNDKNYIVDFSDFKKEVSEFKRKISAPEI